jgi:prepilin-type N-terminal cleavage/methylation domain-containing protein
MHNPNFGGYVMKNRGFSLIEMLFVIGLSGVILVSAMTLMLSFTNIYLSLSSFETQIEHDIFAEKLIRMLLFQCRFSESCSDINEDLLNLGVFWKSDSVPIFACERQEERIPIGLIKDGSKLKFVWSPKDSVNFKHLTLFDDVRNVGILHYDIGNGLWSKHEFSDAVTHNMLAGCQICCFSVKRRGGKEATIPIFEE